MQPTPDYVRVAVLEIENDHPDRHLANGLLTDHETVIVFDPVAALTDQPRRLDVIIPSPAGYETEMERIPATSATAFRGDNDEVLLVALHLGHASRSGADPRPQSGTPRKVDFPNGRRDVRDLFKKAGVPVDQADDHTSPAAISAMIDAAPRADIRRPPVALNHPDPLHPAAWPLCLMTDSCDPEARRPPPGPPRL